MNAPAVTQHIVDWLRTYAQQARARGFAVGVSGGIDSAVTAGLCAATGLDVHLLEMPIHQAPDQVSRAQDWMQLLAERHAAVSARRVDLTAVFDAHVGALALPDSAQRNLALANTRARLRMTTLYAEAQNHGLLVAGTGNKVEDFGVGFFTKYGDGGVDLSPIADLYKSQVYDVARHLGVPQSILDAPPTDGLWSDGRTDEEQLGAAYGELETAMEFARTHHWSPETTTDDHTWATTQGLTARHLEVFVIFTRFHRANLHKMRPIPVCSIGGVGKVG
jgi:NAD+ synthase